MFPKYIYPLHAILKITFCALFNRRLSFAKIAHEMVARQQPPFDIQGVENIPDQGPCVITFNHYHRPGFQAFWLALAIAAQVPAEMHWVMTGELTFPGRWYGFLGRPVSRWGLQKLGNSFGFTRMPPMPPREKDVQTRANAVRQVLSIVRKNPHLILGLAPEGGDYIDGSVVMPAPGFGRFALLLARSGLSFLPVGTWEDAGAFHLNIGRKYELSIPSGSEPCTRDLDSARIIMSQIASLLPEKWKGEFR